MGLCRDSRKQCRAKVLQGTKNVRGLCKVAGQFGDLIRQGTQFGQNAAAKDALILIRRRHLAIGALRQNCDLIGQRQQGCTRIRGGASKIRVQGVELYPQRGQVGALRHHLRRGLQPQDNVAKCRTELVELFTRLGCAHVQIGRSYQWAQTREPVALAVLRAVKQTLDPQHLVNPGSLGL